MPVKRRLLALSAAIGLTAGIVPRAEAATDVVMTEGGAVRGHAGVYQAIPYAAAPVGALRWRPPQPAASWPGERDATRPAPACPQLGVDVPTAEDCLFLNVSTPPGGASGRPVLVFLHGGSNSSGYSAQYPAATLAARTDSVVVTLNYRIGALGFLALPSLGESNFGIQDQQAALRWVRRNIGAFGGDPANVTLFGQSAGALDGCVNLASPPAAGLFQRLILQSGSCDLVALGGTRAAAVARGTSYAAKAGCADGPEQVACLRGKSVADLLAVAPDLGGASVISSWTPVIDGDLVPDDPMTMIGAGGVPRIPVMLGITRDEGRFITALQFDSLTEDEYQKLLESTGGPIGAFILKLAYPSSRYGSPKNALAALYTDTLYACGNDRMARAFASRNPTFAYQFADAQAPGWSLLPERAVDAGAYHGSELPYLFDIPTRTPLSASQQALSDRMARSWGAFAANGSPGWRRFDPLTSPYRELRPTTDRTLLFGAFRDEHQCALWDVLGLLGGA
ncbi:carboxylesterase/lipase family protein [Actinomadura rayongensis]|uniref:Carboxylic ester hydrolase n=1 Tax=Actinomadura rayongensis TaxID=1429076 RepID=A0A6I4W6U3_9ACTN|nr:carboxylesterase family protein [Actinomadura rayongensis]MXQ65231.1 carboxylesterase family protein [Actinomadura rayongensis]